MAGRIRSIKPEILDDEVTANLSDLEYRLFTGTWLVADDYGNLRANADYLRGQILWARKNTTTEDVVAALAELVRVELLTPYTVRDQSYFHIEGWSKHQRVDKPGKPRVPPPPPSNGSRESREDSRESRESPAPDLRSPDHDPEREVEGEPARARARSQEPTPTPLPVGWKPEGSVENAQAAAEAAGRGVMVSHALAKFCAKKQDRTSDNWDREWRVFLVTEYPTPEPIREAITRVERERNAKAARERERAPPKQIQLSDEDREANRRAAKAAIENNYQPPGLRLVGGDSDT